MPVLRRSSTESQHVVRSTEVNWLTEGGDGGARVGEGGSEEGGDEAGGETAMSQ